MRAEQAKTYLATGHIPETLIKIGAARCQGEQHIGRAELWPITIAFEHFSDFILHTDSAYCVDTVNKIQNCAKIAELSEHNEFDLVRRIFNQPKRNQQVVKIAAHKDPRLIKNDVERYHCLGNMLANDSAIDVCLHGEIVLTKQYQELHLQHEQQETQLKRLFDLHLQLQKERAKASTAEEPQPPTNTPRPAKVFRLHLELQQWNPTEPLWTPPTDISTDWLVFSAWGRQVSFVILQWLRDLTWGTTNLGPGELQLGPSWTEIAISISLSLGAWLPFRRRNSDNIENLIHPQTTANARAWGVTLSEMSQNAYLLVTQAQTLIPETIYPPELQNGKVSSLQMQGYHAWTTGFKRRPRYPHQDKVFSILQKLFADEKKPLQSLPDLEFCQQFSLQQADSEATTIWATRYKQSLSKAKIVAKQRKAQKEKCTR